MLKRISSILLVSTFVFTSSSAIFANESISQQDNNIKLITEDNTQKESNTGLLVSIDNKASVPGNFGMAHLTYGSSARELTWRLTSTQGVITSFSGYINVLNNKNVLVRQIPVSGGGSTNIVKQVYVGSLPKGTYKAQLIGSGATTKGPFKISSGLVEYFTVY